MKSVEVRIRKWVRVFKLTSEASPEVADVCKWVQRVWFDGVSGGAVHWAGGACCGRPAAHTKTSSWKQSENETRLYSNKYQYKVLVSGVVIQVCDLPFLFHDSGLHCQLAPVLVVAGLFQSHPPIGFCCWMLTVGVVVGTGELRPVQQREGISTIGCKCIFCFYWWALKGWDIL